MEDRADRNRVSLSPSRAQCPEIATLPCQEFRGRSFSTVCRPNLLTPSSKKANTQWRWSADFCGNGASSIFVVKKNKAKPAPPQRSVSLPLSRTPANSPSKRQSWCTSIHSPSSTGPTSPVWTSVITGPSPLGHRMRPRSCSSSARACIGRLSLQFPPSVNIPALGTDPATNSVPKPDPGSIPKPSRRRYSDSSDFFGSPAQPLPVVTIKEMEAMQLRPIYTFDGTHDILTNRQVDGRVEEHKVAPQNCKVPPPVPSKSAHSKWMAHLISQSLSLSCPSQGSLQGPTPANQGGRRDLHKHKGAQTENVLGLENK